jgi:DnaJ-class molecular chaperone
MTGHLGQSDRTEFRETGRELTDNGKFSTGYEEVPKKVCDYCGGTGKRGKRTCGACQGKGWLYA